MIILTDCLAFAQITFIVQIRESLAYIISLQQSHGRIVSNQQFLCCTLHSCKDKHTKKQDTRDEPYVPIYISFTPNRLSLFQSPSFILYLGLLRWDNIPGVCDMLDESLD